MMTEQHKKIEKINDVNLAPLYHITYRNEMMVTLRANSEKEAKERALMSHNWEFVGDWWEEFVEVEEADLS